MDQLDSYISQFYSKLEKLDYINEDNIEVILDLMYNILD
jgi:hypothetical protein